eukprot:3182280-Amphidinium_carterae.1
MQPNYAIKYAIVHINSHNKDEKVRHWFALQSLSLVSIRLTHQMMLFLHRGNCRSTNNGV